MQKMLFYLNFKGAFSLSPLLPFKLLPLQCQPLLLQSQPLPAELQLLPLDFQQGLEVRHLLLLFLFCEKREEY